MKKTLIIICCFGLVFSSSCNTPESNNTEKDSSSISRADGIPDAHSSRTSLDWLGTYEGITPCADCPGIRMTVTLRDNNTYSMEEEYLERDVAPFEENGTYEWESGGNHIILKSGDRTQRFKVGENQLVLVGNNQTDMPEEISERFVLKKKPAD